MLSHRLKLLNCWNKIIISFLAGDSSWNSKWRGICGDLGLREGRFVISMWSSSWSLHQICKISNDLPGYMSPTKTTFEKCADQDNFAASNDQNRSKPTFKDLMMFILREKVVLNANYIIKSAISTILSKHAPSNLPIFYILRYTTHFAKSYGWILNMFREFVHFSLFWSLNPIWPGIYWTI